MCARALAAAAVAVAALSPGCATATSPRIVSIDDVRAQPVVRGEWIADYDEALVSVATIMQRDLGLPEVRAALHFYAGGAALRAALEAQGYTPDLARDTAATMAAIGGFRRVLINEDRLAGLEWPYRIALVAHELTHTLQYEFSGGRRGASDQWLREGFAEWVEVQVLTRLGFTTPPQARRLALTRVRASGGARSLPPVSDMVTFPQWVALGKRLEQDAVYAHAMLGAELLIERHGVPRIIGYFELFASSDDRAANFRRAFGEELAEFEAAWRTHLESLP